MLLFSLRLPVMFSRLFGGKKDGEEEGNKPWKAQLGNELEMYYSKELKCWVKPHYQIINIISKPLELQFSTTL